MVRYVDSVLIQVSGPKSLLPQPKMETGRMSMTWIHFLNTICGLQLETSSDYFICNSTYTTTSEGGWTANLNDTIKPFIDKFSRKRNLYCVRLHTGKIPDASVNANAAASATTSTTIPDNSNDTTQPWMPKLKTTPVKKFASTVPMKPSQWTSPSSQTGVVELPFPAVRVPIRGCPAGFSGAAPQQSVTAAQLFQKPDGKGKLFSSRRNPSSGSSNKTKNKHIPEFTLRIASGTCKQSIVYVPESSSSSPPKLSRFDEVENTVGMSSAEPQPGPSSNPTTAATCSSSPQKISSPSSSPLKRRYEDDEKDGMNAANEGSINTSDNRTLVEIKREAIEIDLVELGDSDEEEQEGNGYDYDPQALFLNEQNVLGILGILGDDGEDDDGDDLVSQVERKLDEFDKTMLLKIKEEIRKLMQNKLWGRNSKRSPLACYLLQEIFKD